MYSVRAGLLLVLISVPNMLEPVSWSSSSWFAGASKQKSSGYVESCLTALRTSFFGKPFKALQRLCTQEATHLVHYVKQHPIQTVACGCLVTAVGFMRSIKKLEQSLQQPAAWSLWKREIAPAQKRHQYDAHFAHELLHAIQVRYMKLTDIADFMGPIRSFMQDLEHELESVQRYARGARWLQQLGLHHCIDAHLYAESSERIERLEMLKHVCLQWLSKAKLESAT